MRHRIAAAAAVLSLVAAPAFAKPLAAGSPAPAFTLASSTGRAISLAEYARAGRTVVLAFFPKAFTGG